MEFSVLSLLHHNYFAHKVCIIVKVIASWIPSSYLMDISLVPRLSWGRRKESLVTTACACANPYQQNMVSPFSAKEVNIIGWRWCLEDFNKVT